MSKEQLNKCGCCEVPVPPTPEKIKNRPALSSIDYRVGTYATFRQTMIETIASTPELFGWTARSSDDYGIALLEMWAYLADILTFYQERIANEAFLRTALFPESIRRLAYLLDYRPAPGLAATVDLAFTVEKEKEVKIPIGLKVQNVPGQGEKPQKFETINAISADARVNQVRAYPRRQPYNPLKKNSFEGELTADFKGFAPGDKIVFFNSIYAEEKKITERSVADGRTKLSWAPPIQRPGFRPFTTLAAKYGRQFRLFGYNAPESYMSPEPDGVGGIKWVQRKSPVDYNFSLSETNVLSLEAPYEELKPGNQLLLVGSKSESGTQSNFARLATILNVATKQDSLGPLQDTVTEVTLDFKVTATPVVVNDAFGNIQIFTIGDDGALWTIRRSGEFWIPWNSLGGQIDMFAVGSNKDGRLEVFARGPDKALWHIWQLAPGGSWSSWARYGGWIDMLAVGSNKDGRLEVFARGPDKALWHIWQLVPNGRWSLPASLRGWIDMLALGTNEDGRLEVFARGPDKALWHIWQLSPNDVWSNWARFGGQIDMLALGTNKDGRLEVFARSLDKALWHIWQLSPNDGWSSPAPLGGWVDRLAVGSNKDGRLEVFARGPDKALWHIWQISPNDGWSNWARNDELTDIDMLNVGRYYYGSLAVFARGSDKALWHIYQLAPNDDWSRAVSFGWPMWSITDKRNVSVYELTETFACVYNRRYPDKISGNKIYLQEDLSACLYPEQTVILDDKENRPQTVTVTGLKRIDTDGDRLPDHLAVTFTPALKRLLDSETAILYGNVASASHGETVADEVLGDGDASAIFQQFSLKKPPVTYLPKLSGDFDPASTLEVRVGGVLWKEARNLYGHGNSERIYTTSVDCEGATRLQFGDGVTGARLPTGRKNIVAKYRQGLGREGNVPKKRLTKLMDRPLGLKGVTNPAGAEGGVDPETLDKTRINAPNTVRTFDRIVSLRDFEDASREDPRIAKALATWVWDGLEQVVLLTVAGDGGVEVSDEVIGSLTADLDSQRDINRKMWVGSFRPVPVDIEARIHVNDAYLDEDVIAFAKLALEDFFAFDNLMLGQSIHLSDVMSVLQRTEGVLAVDIERLQYHDTKERSIHGVADDPVLLHLPIYSAHLVSTNPVEVRPAELALLESLKLYAGEI